jgi:hypothetical protein
MQFVPGTFLFRLPGTMPIEIQTADRSSIYNLWLLPDDVVAMAGVGLGRDAGDASTRARLLPAAVRPNRSGS